MRCAKIKKRRPFLESGAALCIVSILTLFFVMKYPDTAIEYMQRGLKLCVGVVIPSLFPFMVASELIILSGVSSFLSKPFGFVSRRLFGVSGSGAVAFFLGNLCGFPIGTRTAVALYKKREITHSELSRLICFSNNPSSAFVISAVGVTLFGSRELGVALYFITLLSSVLIGIGQNFLLGGGKDRADISTDSKKSVGADARGIAAFSSAIASCGQTMLSVCAFVVFFSTFTGAIGEAISYFGFSDTLRAVIFSFFEMTCGVATAACVRPTTMALVIAAFAVGWSGLSVHFQVISICGDIPIPMGRYFVSKLLQGLLNVLLLRIYLSMFGKALEFDSKSVSAFLNISGEYTAIGVVVSIIFLVSLLVLLVKKFKVNTIFKI